MNAILSKLKPHLLAFLIGFLIIFAYFPSTFLESKIIDMGDAKRGLSTSHELRTYRDTTGEEALWTNSQFGGMPTFQMYTQYPKNLISHIEEHAGFGLPAQLGLLFSLFLGFYFLGVSLGYKTWISIISAFAFTFSSFFIISLEAGHTGKLRATGYMAFVLLSVLMTMRGKKILGAALTCLFVSLAINANHFQITYYLVMMIAAYMIVELYFHFKEKLMREYFIKSGILVFAAVLAVGPNISRLWTTMDYAEETMRGGKSELAKVKEEDKGGLEKEYAMRWSYGIMETFTFLIPDFQGASSSYQLDADSHTGKELRRLGVPEKQLDGILANLPLYWGDQPFVFGPVYIGAIVVFFFVLGLFILHGRLKIWLLSCIIFSVVLSWGNNFALVTDLFFYYFPLYNKFRTPSMILTVTIFSMVLMAFMALNKVLSSTHGLASYMPEIRKSFFIVGGTCLFFMLLGSSFFSFSGATDSQLPGSWPIDALKEDRQDMLTFSALRSLIFVSIAFGLLWAFSKNKISPSIFIGAMCLTIASDIWFIDKNYLNESHLVKQRGMYDFYKDTNADLVINQDPDPHFRVFNLTANPFTDALTSFHHKSIGGYHGAKLIRYQDVIDHHLSKNNLKVIDMLNTRYYIIRNQETGQVDVKGNSAALGNAWFVNNIIWAKDANEEIETLNTFDPANEAVIDERYKDEIPQGLKLDKSGSTIKLTEYRPNKLTYEANVTSGMQFAVFSEIYYEGTDHDWKVKIDGQPTDHIRVNYILRGMEIPEGQHTIEFEFKPISYFKGEQYALIFSIIVLGFLAFAVVIEIRNIIRRKKEAEESSSA